MSPTKLSRLKLTIHAIDCTCKMCSARRAVRRTGLDVYRCYPETYQGEKLPNGATGATVLMCGPNWVGTYRTSEEVLAAIAKHANVLPIKDARCPLCRAYANRLLLFCPSCEAPLTLDRWSVRPVFRSDAGQPLYAPVRLLDDVWIEHGITPSHDEETVRRAAERLNAGKAI